MTSHAASRTVVAAAAALVLTVSACGDDDTASTTTTTTVVDAGAEAAAVEDVVGMEVDAAESTLTELGYQMRIVRLDGEDLAVTMDYREDRVNVAVEDDVVVAVEGIG
jgi:hypothetical protein